MEIALEGLRIERGGRTVLDVPHLRIASGRTTVLLGPNGAGKTTLLRAIAALERPATGRVRIGSHTAGPDRATRLLSAFDFQAPVLLDRSVRANLEIALALRGVPHVERAARVREAATACGILALLDRSARRLSVGEARRATLARTLSLRAPVLLLDEPLAGLDAPTRDRLEGELPRLLFALARTAVIVSHHRREAFRLADDLVVLVDGQVRAAGPLAQVASNPVDEETAALLGYVVLEDPRDRGRGRVAVEEDGFVPASPGRAVSLDPPFLLDVERVIDLHGALVAYGRIRGRDASVRLPAGTPAPRPGDRVELEAPRAIRLGTRRAQPLLEPALEGPVPSG